MGGRNARDSGGDSDLYKMRESLEMFLPRISIVFDSLEVFLVILKRIETDSCIISNGPVSLNSYIIKIYSANYLTTLLCTVNINIFLIYLVKIENI